MAPDWTRLRNIVDGTELGLETGEVLEHRRLLDLRQGVLWREWRHRDPTGRVTRLRFLRLASLADRHALLQAVTLTPENYSGRVRLEAVVEPAAERSRSATVGPPQQATGDAGSPIMVQVRTATGATIVLAASRRLASGDGQLLQRAVGHGAAGVVESWDWEADLGRTYRLDRLVSVHTSRDAGLPSDAAARHLDALVRGGADAVVEAHARAWEARWQAADVQVDGDEQALRALRFASYHLSSAANPADERASIGARALTGDAYKGHVFWDTEIYMLPFYTFTDPAAARSLLMYRYHTLPAARAKAGRLGYGGALYAWESTDTGEETTPPMVIAPNGEVLRVLTGEQEHHISADVAYAVWQYWRVSGDDEFFVDVGAEIVLETARFWASRVRLEADGRYHIRRVIGPDEYHEGVDDNAYTNVMAQWNLERGAETIRLLAERWPERRDELARRLGISPDEPNTWLSLAAAMVTGFDPATGLFEQFQGFFDLEEVDLTAYEPRTVPMDLLLGRERTQRSKVIKQADVVLLLYLLWDRFPPEVRAATTGGRAGWQRLPNRSWSLIPSTRLGCHSRTREPGLVWCSIGPGATVRGRARDHGQASGAARLLDIGSRGDAARAQRHVDGGIFDVHWAQSLRFASVVVRAAARSPGGTPLTAIGLVSVPDRCPGHLQLAGRAEDRFASR